MLLIIPDHAVMHNGIYSFDSHLTKNQKKATGSPVPPLVVQQKEVEILRNAPEGKKRLSNICLGLNIFRLISFGPFGLALELLVAIKFAMVKDCGIAKFKEKKFLQSFAECLRNSDCSSARCINKRCIPHNPGTIELKSQFF